VSPPLVGTTTYATSGPTIVGGSYGGNYGGSYGGAIGGTVIRSSRVGGTIIGGAPTYVGGTTLVGGPTVVGGATYTTGGQTVVGGAFRSSRVVGTTYGAPVVGTTSYTTGGPTYVGGISTLPGVSSGHVVGGGIVYDRLLPAGTVQY